MSSWLMHLNPDIFPDPYTFDPTRWLEVKQAQYLEKYLVAFGKGSRQCVGLQ
jgi:cytochrome P450